MSTQSLRITIPSSSFLAIAEMGRSDDLELDAPTPAPALADPLVAPSMLGRLVDASAVIADDTHFSRPFLTVSLIVAAITSGANFWVAGAVNMALAWVQLILVVAFLSNRMAGRAVSFKRCVKASVQRLPQVLSAVMQSWIIAGTLMFAGFGLQMLGGPASPCVFLGAFLIGMSLYRALEITAVPVLAALDPHEEGRDPLMLTTRLFRWSPLRMTVGTGMVCSIYLGAPALADLAVQGVFHLSGSVAQMFTTYAVLPLINLWALMFWCQFVLDARKSHLLASPPAVELPPSA